MQRVVEPELMEDVEQAQAYDAADFSASHDRRVDVFRELVPPSAWRGRFLDLGCGSGDLDFRFLAALPECSIVAVDGARAMVELGSKAVEGRPEFQGRIAFVESFIPSDSLPPGPYATIMSNSFLHHLHNPQVLWDTIKGLASPDSFIFVSDLRRPRSEAEAKEIVRALAGQEAQVLQQDFYNSLCAAFEVPEIKEQLRHAGIHGLTVEELDDIHLVVYGTLERV